MTRPDDIPKDVWEAAGVVPLPPALSGPAGWREVLHESIARAILEAGRRGAERQRERIAKRYDDAADEFDKQAIETMSVADKLRLDTLAANHRQFADAIRHQETSQ